MANSDQRTALRITPHASRNHAAISTSIAQRPLYSPVPIQRKSLPPPQIQRFVTIRQLKENAALFLNRLPQLQSQGRKETN
jgi:hypothetical protein